jgi:hypothetical protein
MRLNAVPSRIALYATVIPPLPPRSRQGTVIMPLYLKVIKDMLIGNTKYVQYCTVLELAAGSLKNEGSEEIGQTYRQG